MGTEPPKSVRYQKHNIPVFGCLYKPSLAFKFTELLMELLFFQLKTSFSWLHLENKIRRKLNALPPLPKSAHLHWSYYIAARSTHCHLVVTFSSHIHQPQPCARNPDTLYGLYHIQRKGLYTPGSSQPRLLGRAPEHANTFFPTGSTCSCSRIIFSCQILRTIKGPHTCRMPQLTLQITRTHPTRTATLTIHHLRLLVTAARLLYPHT